MAGEEGEEIVAADRLDGVGGVERCVRMGGEPLLRQRPVGDDDQLVPGGRLALPAVRRVEQVAADHLDRDGVPERLHVVERRP